MEVLFGLENGYQYGSDNINRYRYFFEHFFSLQMMDDTVMDDTALILAVFYGDAQILFLLFWAGFLLNSMFHSIFCLYFYYNGKCGLLSFSFHKWNIFHFDFF